MRLWHDLRDAVRSLRKSWGFTALATASLAIGLGANTALFGLVDALLRRPLPVPDPDRLVLIQREMSNGKRLPIDRTALDVIRGLDAVFANAAVTMPMPSVSVAIDDALEPGRVVHAAAATLFPTLGLAPRLGTL